MGPLTTLGNTIVLIVAKCIVNTGQVKSHRCGKEGINSSKVYCKLEDYVRMEKEKNCINSSKVYCK